ncbi:MAG: hypothetical protein DMD67_05755 [Gemmatimonadetes bacterium]|nr:MAG: hypothetical protein DMD67_05755 [Gemmatimonadota bacterium]
MPLSEAILQALQTAWSNKLRSFFTLLGIIVSVGFLVAVVAVIQGMNAYVRERIAGAIVGVNAFQIRRDPIQVGFIDDEELKKIQRRPIIGPEDVSYVERALPDAPHRGRRPRVRCDTAVRGRAGLHLRGRGAVHGRGRATAAARRGAWLRRRGEAVRRSRARRRERYSGPRRAAPGQRRHREERHGAGAILGRVRHAPAHHLRKPVRPAADHCHLGQDARGSRTGSGRDGTTTSPSIPGKG